MVKVRLLSILLFLFSSATAQHQLSLNKSERLYQKGRELVAHANYGAARQVFTEFLESAAPGDARRSDAEYYIAFSALNLNHSDGEKLTEHFVESNPSSPRARTAWFDLGNFFYEEKNYAKASSYYKRADFEALSMPQQTEGKFKWGYSLFNLRKLEDALVHFNAIKTLSGEYQAAASYYAGFIEYSSGDYAAALADLKRAEQSSTYAAVVPVLIANVYYRQRRYDDAVQYISSLRNRKDISNQAELSMVLAEAYFFKGDYKNAATEYENYLGDNASKAEPGLLYRAGFSNYSLNQTRKAIDLLGRAASSKDTVSFYASYYLGVLYVRQGEKPLAANAFNVARKYSRDSEIAEEAAFQYAKVTYHDGKAEQAVTEFERFLTAYPSSEHSNEVKELLAQAHISGNNYQKAIEYIESLSTRSASVDEAYQKANYLLGVELFNKDNYEQAALSFEKSLKYPRSNKFVMLAAFWAGESYSAGRRYEDALRHYEKVLSMPSSVEPETALRTRYGIGYAHYNLQQYDKALVNFREFVTRGGKKDPNQADALLRLADCYYVSKQYAPALETYGRARAAGSADTDYILLQTGVINGIQRNYAGARNDLTTLIRTFQNSPYRDEALFQRAQFEIESGNYQAAIDGLSQLIRDSPNSKYVPYALMRRATSSFNLKQYSATAEDYGQVLTKYPNHPVAQDALIPLQEALNLAGKPSEFDKYLTAFKAADPNNKNLEQIEFDAGKNLFFDQQYEQALQKLSAFVVAYPGSARVSEANFYVAESHYRLKDFAKALPVYQGLSADKSFTMLNRVEARISELLFREGKYENAIVHFHRLEKLATNKKEQYNAWAGLMESFFSIGAYDSSAAYARIIIDKGAVNASAHNKASLYLGTNALAKGDYETAQDEFINTLNAAQDEFGAEAKYSLAQILFEQKKYKQSYETLVGLTNDFASYEDWIGKAYLLIAENFMGMNNTFQAKATLQSLLDNFPGEEVKQKAAARLREIEKAEAEKIQSDSTTNDK